MVANNATITSTISLSWYTITRDSIDTGINPFRFGETDAEAEHQLQAQVELMLSGQGNPSFQDAQRPLETKVVLPTANNSNKNIRGMQIWCLTFLPPNHPIQAFLENHYTDIFLPIRIGYLVPYAIRLCTCKRHPTFEKTSNRDIRILERRRTQP